MDAAPPEPVLIGAATRRIDLRKALPAIGAQGRMEAPRAENGTLEVNCVAFGHGAAIVVLASVDTLFIGARLTAFLSAAAARHWPGKQVETIAFASHTHSAPSTDEGKPAFGGVDPEHWHTVAQCLDSALAELAAKPGTPASVRLGEKTGRFAVNRRLLVRRLLPPRLARHAVLAPEPEGPADARVKIGLLEAEGGRTAAVLVQVACHPTAFPVGEGLCADYIDVVRSRIRAAMGGEVPVLFMLGHCGDVRPDFTGPAGLRQRLTQMPAGRRFRAPDRAEWAGWAGGIAECATAALEAARAATPERADGLAFSRFGCANPYGPADPVPFAAAALRMTPRFTLVAVNAEISVRFLDRLDGVTFTASCADDTIGYLQPQDDLPFGGYEIDGFRRGFAVKSAGFRPGAHADIGAVLDQARSFVVADA